MTKTLHITYLIPADRSECNISLEPFTTEVCISSNTEQELEKAISAHCERYNVLEYSVEHRCPSELTWDDLADD